MGGGVLGILSCPFFCAMSAGFSPGFLRASGASTPSCCPSSWTRAE
jgi:hypothetical protein